MSTDPSFSFDLHPGLDAELDAAYERHVGLSTDPEALASKGLAAAVANFTSPKTNILKEGNISEEFEASFLDAYSSTGLLFLDSLNRDMPDFTSAEFTVINWERLNDIFMAMESAKMEPVVVITPPPQTLDYWKELYAGLDKELIIDDPDISENWDELNGASGINNWSINVISARREPYVLNGSYECTKDVVAQYMPSSVNSAIDLIGFTTANEIYPDMTTYLTLQALTFKNAKDPLDPDMSSTWLKDTCSGIDSRYGVLAGSSPGGEAVHLRRTFVDSFTVGGSGMRPTVRGEKS